ncbi:hypothetical protein [Pseudokineococcus lusitanus]|uniref:Uncharacterized protein n=1 Tax=Pseudokineococcus lusitanus TaxID=763993 RepID=A0A3N1G953_9ACTN|nr:hypothetical protein [Pseudokineococcus lusitanus]ROP26753.1 hypothetical protein EDC03_3223 [Pseudokineococcus lusitanus]
MATGLVLSTTPGATAATPGAVLPTPTGHNVFAQSVAGAPLHRDSQALVADVVHQVASRYKGVAAFNVRQYNVSAYQVPAGQRRVDVRFDDCQKKGYVPRSMVGPGGPLVQVPVPDDAVPSPGGDRQLTIYSPDGDQLWELWKVSRTSQGWQACWGGRLDRVSQSLGVFPGSTGASASGLSEAMGAVSAREVSTGRIRHAITLSLPEVAHRSSFSYPAQRSDGSTMRSSAPAMGTRFRLDPRLDVASLDLHPVAAAVARAAQTYGFIVGDRSGAVSVAALSGEPDRALTGVDPWADVLDGTASHAVMRDFPWERLQALPEDWGEPQ